jgi:ferredoxin
VTGPDPGRRLRAIVDHEECFGFAFCIDILPSTFSLDDEGHSVARDVDADPALLGEAVDTCPRSAISLVLRAEGERDEPAS